MSVTMLEESKSSSHNTVPDTGFFIRRARRKDRFEMKSCNERNLTEHYDIEFWESTIMSYPGMSVVLCNPVGKVKGYILSSQTILMSYTVDQDFRGKGWGTKLMDFFLKNHPGDFLELQVRVSNTGAQKIYEKFGFRVGERMVNYYHTPSEDAFQMVLKRSVVV